MIHKCAFKHCQHESRDIKPCDEVQLGKRYMHSDCAAIHSAVQEAEALFKELIDPDVSLKNLRVMISSLVFDQNVDPAFLCFAIRWAKRNANLNYPGGLKYIVADEKCKAAWNQQKADKVIKQMREVQIKPTESFKYTPDKPLTLMSALG